MPRSASNLANRSPTPNAPTIQSISSTSSINPHANSIYNTYNPETLALHHPVPQISPRPSALFLFLLSGFTSLVLSPCRGIWPEASYSSSQCLPTVSSRPTCDLFPLANSSLRTKRLMALGFRLKTRGYALSWLDCPLAGKASLPRKVFSPERRCFSAKKKLMR